MNIEKVLKKFDEKFVYQGEGYAKGTLKWNRGLKDELKSFIRQEIEGIEKEITSRLIPIWVGETNKLSEEDMLELTHFIIKNI
jgi:hypothetical protein